jgi:hypothetical protein
MERRPTPARAVLSRVAAIAVALMLAAPAASAQQWVQQPDGSYLFQTSYTTSATFGCLGLLYAPGTTCQTSGSTLQLTNGGRSIALSFTGTTQSLAMPLGGPSPRVTLGTLDVDFSGTEPFSWPPEINGAQLFQMNLQVQMAGMAGMPAIWVVGAPVRSPVPGAGFDGSAFAIGAASYLTFGVPPYPLAPGSPLRLAIAEVSQGFVLPPQDARLTFEATASVVPEPATVSLTGIGLLALLGAARARRRAPARAS